jgi:hypothetical protein
LLANMLPRSEPHVLTDDSGQACGRTAHMEDPVMEGNSRTVCGGLPSWSTNVDHDPSIPSLGEIASVSL